LSFSDRVGVGSYSNLNIYMIDVNKGSAVRQIASGNEDEQNPEFSDEGNLLFYSKNNSGNYTLWSQDLKKWFDDSIF
jgi:Tol biopolymer transport system component